MSDAALRELERAVAGGDEAARPRLAQALARAGRRDEALALVAALPAAGPELREVEHDLWREELAGLARARGVRLDAMAADRASPLELVGFPAGRWVAFTVVHPARGALLLLTGLEVVDLVTGARAAELSQREAFAHPLPAHATRRGIVGPGGRAWVERDGRWVEETALPGDEVPGADPEGERALVRSGHDYSVVRLADGAAGRRFTSRQAPVWSWALDRVVWREPAGWRQASLGGDEPPRPCALPAPPLQFLEDGRLLAGPPARLVSLAGGPGEEPPLPLTETRPPFTLARRGPALLGLRGPRSAPLPVRAPLSAPPLHLGPRPVGRWHPRADLLATQDAQRDEVLVLDARGGDPVVRLPGRQALGWTPDGAALLVHAGGALELWTPGGRDWQPPP